MENNYNDQLRSDTVYPQSNPGSSNELSPLPNNKKRNIILAVVGVVVVAVVIMLAVRYSDLLGASVVRSSGIAQGSALTAQVKGTTQVRRVDLCQYKYRGTRCTSLNYTRAGNTVKANVPANYPLGQAVFKITGVGPKNKPAIVEKKVTIVAPKPETGGGGGGGNGGGGGGGGGEGTPPNPYSYTPTPTAPPNPYGPTVTPTATVTPRPTVTPPVPYGS